MTPSITKTLAVNLAHFMKEKGVVQTELAKRSGVGQTTISLYLNPESRNRTKNTAEPSPTLAKVQALAAALQVELWELLRPLTPAQRDLVKSVDAVIKERLGDADTDTVPGDLPDTSIVLGHGPAAHKKPSARRKR